MFSVSLWGRGPSGFLEGSTKSAGGPLSCRGPGHRATRSPVRGGSQAPGSSGDPARSKVPPAELCRGVERDALTERLPTHGRWGHRGEPYRKIASWTLVPASYPGVLDVAAKDPCPFALAARLSLSPRRQLRGQESGWGRGVPYLQGRSAPPRFFLAGA